MEDVEEEKAEEEEGEEATDGEQGNEKESFGIGRGGGVDGGNGQAFSKLGLKRDRACKKFRLRLRWSEF